MTNVLVFTDLDFIAYIKARSERAPERDVPPDIECWREGSKEHYFLRGAYWQTLASIPVQSE